MKSKSIGLFAIAVMMMSCLSGAYAENLASANTYFLLDRDQGQALRNGRLREVPTKIANIQYTIKYLQNVTLLEWAQQGVARKGELTVGILCEPVNGPGAGRPVIEWCKVKLDISAAGVLGGPEFIFTGAKRDLIFNNWGWHQRGGREGFACSGMPGCPLSIWFNPQDLQNVFEIRTAER